MTRFSLTEPGHFVLGANYWASHAGTAMWTDWRPEVVDEDLCKLAQAGIQALRVFPLWPDFQPLKLLRTGSGAPAEFRFGEERLPEDEAGKAGVSAEMIAHFATFADLAQKHGLKLVVGLITGWMSGRLFVPPALEALNVLTDPRAILWEVRLVKYFVKHFRQHPAIAAWDLGNECNCMAHTTREEAWVWTATIVDAIHASDPERPIVSGMHSLPVDPKGAWAIADQAELTDLLTTHPYPVFTPHCDQDPVNTIRTCLHATAESRVYGDVGGKPCLTEEIGTLGPMICSEAIAADFIRTGLFSLWANDCHGLFWWCAHDQVLLEHAPYDWHAVERELGLFRADGSAKPVAGVMGSFGKFIQGLPFEALPPRRTEAVCILSDGQDQWGVAYSSMILAKQAGFDLTFQYETQPLREAELYLVPCITGHRVIHRGNWLKLLERVKAGATLYISHQNGFLAPFNDFSGLEVQTRARREAPAEVTMDALPGKPRFTTAGPFKLTLKTVGAEVLGREADGNPAFTCARYGLGKVYFLTFPLEMELTSHPGTFHGPQAAPAWQVYREVAQEVVKGRAVAKRSPLLGVTEHVLDAGKRVIVAVNYSPAAIAESFTLADGWKVAQALYGERPAASGSTVQATVQANDALVFTVTREG